MGEANPKGENSIENKEKKKKNLSAPNPMTRRASNSSSGARAAPFSAIKTAWPKLAGTAIGAAHMKPEITATSATARAALGKHPAHLARDLSPGWLR